MSFDGKQEMYQGIWQGKTVVFDRTFRGHYFTDAECAALCRGEDIVVQDLGRGLSRYSVLGRLQERSLQGVQTAFTSVRFCVTRTIDVCEDDKGAVPALPLAETEIDVLPDCNTDTQDADMDVLAAIEELSEAPDYGVSEILEQEDCLRNSSMVTVFRPVFQMA